ncbi:MAG: flagellin lysine-N-methylase [Lachnospira sp.]|nr:flagellin lysine-N-methylase [Lachnospira sp.]
MILRTPHYYKKFICIASECKDNCCVGGWQIDIDDETAEYYQNVTGEFGDRLRESIEYTDAYCFRLKDGQCPFLDDKGLCEVYKHLGEDKLGVVCAQFPRFSEYYGDIKETGIGLACEEAERIIFTDTDAFSFDMKELDEEPVLDSEFDAELAKSLFVYRDKVIALFDTESEGISLTDKLRATLLSSSYIQEMINNNSYEEITQYVTSLNLQKLLDEVSSDGTGADFTLCEAVYRILCAYSGLETLNPAWPNVLDRLFSQLHEADEDDNIKENTNIMYEELSKEFDLYISINNRGFEYNNLIKYYVFRYFMKAAYDHDILGKSILTIANWIVIRDMDISRWLDNGKTFTFEDRIDTVHIFSRQVEYSEDNLWELNEEFMFDDIFDTDSLNSLLEMM